MNAGPLDVATVVVCTRNRATQLAATLDALVGHAQGFPMLVVDQSDTPDAALTARELRGELTVLRGTGRGLSRARNAAWHALETAWVVYVDDDCLVEAGWSAAMRELFAEHPDAAFVSGDVRENQATGVDGLVVTAFRVDRAVGRRGPRTRPWAIGFGVCMAVRRDWIERLGGWDERMGAGNPLIPAAEDMDFNYRLLRAGGLAVASPLPRALHDQWRSPEEMPGLFYGYALGWAALCAKLLHTGDARGAVRFWCFGAYAAMRMAASGVRRHSALRLRVGSALLRGHAIGTVRGQRTDWSGMPRRAS